MYMSMYLYTLGKFQLEISATQDSCNDILKEQQEQNIIVA